MIFRLIHHGLEQPHLGVVSTCGTDVRETRTCTAAVRGIVPAAVVITITTKTFKIYANNNEKQRNIEPNR